MRLLNLATSFVQTWKVPGTQIRRPSKFVFLCGGRIEGADEPPSSARDAFLRYLPQKDRLGSAIIVRAEQANQKLAESNFDDLLDLEEYSFCDR